MPAFLVRGGTTVEWEIGKLSMLELELTVPTASHSLLLRERRLEQIQIKEEKSRASFVYNKF